MARPDLYRRRLLCALGAAALPGSLLAQGKPAPARPIGIQLYTVRDFMQREAERTLAALAEIGYREVELVGLYGMSARALRAMLDRNGLVAPSSHVSLESMRKDLPRVINDAVTLGQRYVVCPSIPPNERTLGGYRAAAAALNAAGDRAAGANLQLAYHNHDFEFAKLGNVTGYDVLVAELDAARVQLELDLYWITKGGGDPLYYFAKLPNRFPLLHLKDMARDGRIANVGQGTIDFARIFAQAQRAGVRHYFVEHDNPTHPLLDADASYRYLRERIKP